MENEETGFILHSTFFIFALANRYFASLLLTSAQLTTFHHASM